MQRSDTEPFPAFIDDEPEPFPAYNSELADDDFLRQIEFQKSSFLVRSPLTRKYSSIPRPSSRPAPKEATSTPRPSPHNNQRHIFESFPDFEPGPRVSSHVNELSISSSGYDITHGSVPVHLMSEASMPNLNSPLGLANMQYSGAPYAKFWETSKTYKAHVNDVTVSNGNTFEEDPAELIELDGETMALLRKGKVKEKFSRMVSALHRRRPSGEVEREGKGEKGHHLKHDPRASYYKEQPFVIKAALDALRQLRPQTPIRKHSLPNPFLKPDPRLTNIYLTAGTQPPTTKSHNRAYSHSFSINSISRTISKRLTRPEPDYRDQMLGLAEQRYPVPNLYCILPTERVSSINHWVATLAADVPDDERQENFVALTTAELIGVGGADIDGIEIVKKYYAPMNSPVLQAVEPDEVEDIFEEDELRPRRKDLIEYLGTQRNSGFHLVSMMDISGSTFDDPLNLSDYYGIPLIEPEKAICLNPSEHSSSLSSSISSTSTRAVFKDPRRYLPPAHSLILYLHGKGRSLSSIISLLCELDRTWLFEHQNRWFKNLRVPDLVEFTDEMVKKIRVECRREMEYWEVDGARDEKGGMYPLAWKVLIARQREMDVRRLVERVVERYFGARCRRKRVFDEDLEVKVEVGV